MKSSPHSLFLALFALVFFGACSHEKEEAGALLHAIDQFRAASDDTKEVRVAELTGIHCTTPEICDTKIECLKWAEPTARALAIKVQAQKTLADIQNGREQPDDPNVKNLPDRLDEASRLLDEGHASIEPCEEKVAGLRIKYRL